MPVNTTLKFILGCFAVMVVISSCTKDAELLAPAATPAVAGEERSLVIPNEGVGDITDKPSESIPVIGGAEVRDDYPEDGITDDDDDDDDEEEASARKSSR